MVKKRPRAVVHSDGEEERELHSIRSRCYRQVPAAYEHLLSMITQETKKTHRKKVFVGMSGGVDSSVSAALLKEAGFDVTGVFIKAWYPDFLDCSWRSERMDAMRVAVALGIPFLTFDCEKEYKKNVIDYMIATYAKGHTPNPDVMCNRSVKFDAFWRRAKALGADAIAMGHYARISDASTLEAHNTEHARDNTKYSLLAGTDLNKDQSYFLWTLTQTDLSHTLFPIGDRTKSEVRNEARRFHLSVAEKSDSQGICFLGAVDLTEFLAHFIDVKKGNVLNERGEIIGTHDGAVFYTLGQRHGFTITKKAPDDGAHYIVAKDTTANTLTVGSRNALKEEYARATVDIEQTNWIGRAPQEGKWYAGRIRYRQKLQKCLVTLCNHGTQTVTLRFDEPQSAVTPGQSVVLYQHDICLGGGVIAPYDGV